MLKSKSLLYLLLALACMAGPVAASGSAATSTLPKACMAAECPGLSAQLGKKILEQALAEWPVANNYTYGTFRSAYNHGTLIIDETWHPTALRLAYNVTYGGLTVCVLLPA